MPGAPVHRISFSAPSAAPMAAATVSALMLSSVPLSSADSGLITGIRPLSSCLADDADVDRIDVADEAEVDGLGLAGELSSAGADAHGSARHRRPTGRPR